MTAMCRWMVLKLETLNIDLRYHNHEELVREILLFLHSNFTGRYWENHTGAVKTTSGHFQRYGLVGSTDIIGHTGQGRAVYIEVKTNSGRLSKDQQKFRDMALKSNCIHAVLRENFKDEIFNIGLHENSKIN